MGQFKRLLSRLKITHKVLGLVLLFSGVFVYSIVSNSLIEEYCRQTALKRVGGDKGWTSTLVPAPVRFKEITGVDTIFIGFNEQLECEQHLKSFTLSL